MTLFKKRITLLVDRPGWAFDNSAQQIADKLATEFSFQIKYVIDSPILDPQKIDLLYVFFWGEEHYKKFNFERDQIIKLVSSHRWVDDPRYGPCTPSNFAQRYLGDCDTVACSSLRLFDEMKEVHSNVYHVKHGFSPSRFQRLRKREGVMTIGWAGNVTDEVKGYTEILIPACGDRFKLLSATGNRSHADMNQFYNEVDVFVVSSRHEGEPLTLIEAMAAGCFPVCSDVGIVPELVRHQQNGYIVNPRTPQKFAEAFAWCEQNLEKVRATGEENAREMLRTRSWDVCTSSFTRLFKDSIKRATPASRGHIRGFSRFLKKLVPVVTL